MTRRASIIVVAALLLTPAAVSQPPAPRSGEDQVVQEVEDLTKLQELEQFVAAHPPADAIDAARYEIAALRLRALDPGLPRSQRAAQVQILLARRDRLIRENPHDPRRAVLLADQAADLFFLDFPIDGAGLTALVGVPSIEQRARARGVAAQMNDLAAESELLIEDAIVTMESAPGYAASAALKDRRRRLDETQRQRRIPFLHGVAACLAAELSARDETQRHHLYVLATQLLVPLGEELEGTLAAQTRIYCGLALARLGDFDAAENMFRAAATSPGSDPNDVFAARMMGVINRTIRGGAEAGLEALTSVEQHYGTSNRNSNSIGDPNADHGELFFRVLLADARFLLDRRRAMAEPAGPARMALLVKAFNGYGSHLSGLRGAEHQAAGPASAAAPPPGSLHALVLAKLVAAVDNESQPLPLDELPALVSVAVASRWSGDDATAAQGIDLFQRVLKRDDLDEPGRAAALFGLARAQWSAGQPMSAVERYTQLARDHPTDSEAERAIELAAAIAAGEYVKSPGNAPIRNALDETLRLLLERYPNLADINRWRLLAGELALAEERLDEAGRVFGEIPPSASTWLDGQVMLVRLAQMRCQPGAEPASRRQCFEGVLSQIDQIRTLIESRPAPTDNELAAHAHSLVAHLRVAQARTQIELAQPLKAIEALGDLDADPLLDKPLRGEALRVKMTAYQAADRPEDVLRQLRRFLDSASPTEEAGAPPARPEEAELVLTSLMATIIAEVQSLIDDSRPEEALARAQRELEPMAAIIDEWSAGGSTQRRGDTRFRRLIADSFRLSARWDKAWVRYQRLLEQQPDAAELLYGTAECLYALGGGEAPRDGSVDADRLGQAMVIYKRLAAIGDAPENQYFWTAQLRMLQILNATGRNTRQIVPQIKRLRLLDADLGGERFRRRFDALQNRYAGRE